MTWTGPRRWPGRSPAAGQWASVLADLAEAAAEAGDLDRAQALAEQAEAAARSITDPDRQAEALAGVAAAMARAGDLDRAQALARSINDPS